MVNNRVDVIIRTQGGSRATQQITGIGTAARGTNFHLQQIQRTLRLVGSVNLVGFVNVSEQLRRINNNAILANLQLARINRTLNQLRAGNLPLVARGIRNVGRASADANIHLSQTQRLLRFFAVFTGGLFVANLGRAIDSYATLENRLRAVSGSQEELTHAQNELFAIAQRTRREYESTVEIYARTALATKALGIEQERLLRFTELVNKAVAIGGTRNQEARNALIQLSQGLASGTLRGDELRSVLEQLPVVADIIARRFNLTAFELRQFAATGKVTSEEILNAFDDAGEELDRRYLQIIRTPGQAIQVLNNAINRYISGISGSLGITDKFISAVLILADNIEHIGRVVGHVVVVLGSLGLLGIIGIITRAFVRLAIVVSSNPFSAFIAAITIVIGQLAAFGGIIDTVGGKTRVLDILIVAFQDLTSFITGATTEINSFGDAFDAIDDLIESVSETLIAFGGRLATILDFVVNAFSGDRRTLLDLIVNVFETATIRIRVLFRNMLEAILDDALGTFTRIGNALVNAVTGPPELRQQQDEFINVTRAIEDQISLNEQLSQEHDRITNQLREEVGLYNQALTSVERLENELAQASDFEQFSRIEQAIEDASTEAFSRSSIVTQLQAQLSELRLAAQDGAAILENLVNDQTQLLGRLGDDAPIVDLESTIADRHLRIELENINEQISRQRSEVGDLNVEHQLLTLQLEREIEAYNEIQRQIDSLSTGVVQTPEVQTALGSAAQEGQDQEIRITGLQAALSELQLLQEDTNTALQGLEDRRQEIIGILGDELSADDARLQELQQNRQAIIQQIASEGTPISDYFQGLLRRASERTAAQQDGPSRPELVPEPPPIRFDTQFEEYLAGLQQEIELLRLSNNQREIQEGLIDAEKELKRDLTETDKIIIQSQLEQIQNLDRQGNVLSTVQDSYIGFADQVGQSLVNAFQSAEDAFVDFLVRGEDSFGDFVDAIISDLLRLAIRQQITQNIIGPIAGSLQGLFQTPTISSGSGSIIGGGSALGGYITGPGTSRSDSIPRFLSNGEFVVNAESTRRNRGLLEAVNRGANVGGGGTTNIQINIIDRRQNEGGQPGDGISVQRRSGPDGEIIDVLVEQSVNRLIDEGRLDSINAERYGFRPSLRA